MECGADVDDDGAARAGVHEHAVEPGAGVIAGEGRSDVRIVLEIVADDQGRAMVA
jgi:hypothetical protein